jgi:hypothetical protein
MDTAGDILRRTIGAKYTEARANCDHRDLDRRHYYQALSERILPQCRRILLDEQKRALYDEQCRLHRAGDPRALGYVAFQTMLKHPEALEGKDPSNGSLPALQNPPATLPARLRKEMSAAQTLVQDMEEGLALDLLPTASVTTRNAAQGPTPSLMNAPLMNAPTAPAMDASASAPIRARHSEPAAPAAAGTEDEQADEAARIFDAAFVRVAGTENYLESTPLAGRPSAAAQSGTSDAPRAETMIINGRPAGTRNVPAARLSVGEATPQTKRKPTRDERHILSPLALNLLTAIVAVMLTFTIQYFANAPATAVGDRVPLVVSYAPELGPFLEHARAEFEKTGNGARIEVILQPQGARAGMRQALGQDGTPSDVWIPAETMWVSRYNQAAGAARRNAIGSATPLALSPLVLIARADHAVSLLKRFPNHRIPSWEALRVAVAQDAPGRLGLTDPQRSGSGAIVRYFMAREWSRRHQVSWNGAATDNAALWRWLDSFEKNVPAADGTTADLVKDMVLGTRGLYWWTVAYESDAIHWLNEGKSVDIFYLPVTNFAEHPFCHIARLNAHPQARTASILFERFLRTTPMQQALLKSGFRPTEIDLQSSMAGNPFRAAKYRQRGLQSSGFPLDERLDYRLINQLTARWGKRFTS